MFLVPHRGSSVMDVCLSSCFLFWKFVPLVFPIESQSVLTSFVASLLLYFNFLISYSTVLLVKTIYSLELEQCFCTMVSLVLGISY